MLDPQSTLNADVLEVDQRTAQFASNNNYHPPPESARSILNSQNPPSSRVSQPSQKVRSKQQFLKDQAKFQKKKQQNLNNLKKEKLEIERQTNTFKPNLHKINSASVLKKARVPK